MPKNEGREKSPGQYIKRFRITNEGTELRQAMIAVYVQAEINGGVGDIGLELARPGSGSAGHQSWARPFQPQARSRFDHRVRTGAGPPRRRGLRANWSQRGHPLPVDRAARRQAGVGRSSGQRRVHRAGAAIGARSSTGCGRPSPGSDRPIPT